MPRNRRESDATYNMRRRAKRYVARLTKQLEATKSRTERRIIKSQIKATQSAIKESYRGSGYSIAGAKQKIENITNAKQGKQRLNDVFRQQIGLASSGKKSLLGSGKTGQMKVKAFYRATQKYWSGTAPNDRNAAIMKALGVSSLAEAYDAIMRRQDVKEALKIAKNGDSLTIANTAENIAFSEGIDEFEASPQYLGFIDV